MPALFSMVLFVIGGLTLGLVGLGAGRLLRPKNPHPEKAEAYECGEMPIGSAHVQFDLRFYVVALVYLVFAVEVVLFYPWAVAYGSADQSADPFTLRAVALVDMLIFFALIVVGFAYLWRFGYLDWIKSERKIES